MSRRPLHAISRITYEAQRLAGEGPVEAVTISAVVAASGAPAGSIYHRFASRDDLLAAAWLDALGAFQASFLGVLVAAPDSAAVGVVRWARAHPVPARLLVLRLPRDLGATAWAETRRAEARRLSAALESGLDQFCSAHLGGPGGDARRRATFALLDLPHAALRRYLAAGVPPPTAVDDYVTSASRAILAAG